MGGKGYTAASDMVNLAGVGVGGRGSIDIRGFAPPEVVIQRTPPAGAGAQSAPRPASSASASPAASGYLAASAAENAKTPMANIYALCDVDSVKAASLFKSFPKAKIYSDWREMLDKEPSIDAVMIGTPDHNHAPISAAFIKAKKHVYVEKPMAKTIFECRELAKLAKQYDVVTQMGNQGHAMDGTRQVVEWVQSGVIGNVREVTMATDRPTWPQGNLIRPAGVPVPKTLNYDVWLGPAPEKPYHPDILHSNWRGLWDYGVGAMGDIGAHVFDAPIWALNLTECETIKIEAATTPYSEDYLPAAEWVTYEFPERFIPGVGYMPPVKLTWCDGGLRAPRPATLEPGRIALDTMYIGDKGVMMAASHGAVPQIVPEDPGFKGPDPWLPRAGNNIYKDFIDAIKNGKKSCNDFSYASKVTEIMLLTNIAVLNKQYNKALEYDVKSMKITNVPEANIFFHYEYREGWSL